MRAEAQRLRREILADLIAVSGHLNEPYPDDARWTPWTRFVERAIRRVDELAVLAGAPPLGAVIGAAGVSPQEGAPQEAPDAKNAPGAEVGIGYTLATGRLFCDMSAFHAFAEGLLGRPVFTHEFSDKGLWERMRQKFESGTTRAAVGGASSPDTEGEQR